MSAGTPIENIQLSFVCEKDWQKMTSCSNGKVCSDCNKTVIDFTAKSLEDLHQALKENEHVCGRFHKSQLAPKPIQVPFSLKHIAASIVLAAGFCTLKEAKAQAGSCSTLDHVHKKDQSETTFGLILQTDPVFKFGGDTALVGFIQKNLQQPPGENLNGLVVTYFIIDAEGKVQDPKIVKGLTPWADKEALRVVKLLEFIPSVQDGRNVPIRYTLPVRFSDAKRSDE